MDRVRFPFDAQFQRKIVKLALTDDSFCTIAVRYLQPIMFSSDALIWIWKQIQAEREAKRTPTPLVIRDRIRNLEQVIQPRYHAMMEAVEQEVLQEGPYLRHALGEFVRRNLFVAAYRDSQKIYNVGRADEAIDLMREATEKIHQVRFDAPDRHWYYDDLGERQRIRKDLAFREWEVTFPTGVTGVDAVLDGGLSKGELGAWIADSKGGKSLFLVHLAGYAARALQRNVLVVLLEGNWLQTASRLDAWHTHELYSNVKRGEFTSETWQRMQHEFHMLRRKLVIRAMTDAWSYNAGDIRSELDDLYAQEGWRPDMIVCDYGDLLRSQGKAYSEEEHQRNAFSDLKAMTSQDGGYGIWTASQSQRPPKEQYKTKKQKEADQEGSTNKFGKYLLGPKDIADSYNKVRRADFIGSINQDKEDKANGTARLYCAVYRDNAADRVVRIRQTLDRMMFVDVMDPLNRPDRPAQVLSDLGLDPTGALG